MIVVKPRIELTTEEIKAIDTVIKLCDKMRDLDGCFLSMMFDDDFMEDSFTEVISTLKAVLDNPSVYVEAE